MTYEETKKMLKSLSGKKRLLRSLERQIAEEQSHISISAVNYGNDRVQGGEGTPQAQRFAEHMEKLQEDFYRLLEEVFSIEDFLAAHLRDLSEIEQTIILERYLRGKSWRELERQLHYSPQGIYKLNHSALKKISKDERVE